MEITLLKLNGEKGKQKLPIQFSELVRPDIIKKAVHALQSRRRQSYGTDTRAGKKFSAKLSKRRRKYRGSYGHGISRIPRKIMSRRGTQFNWVGAIVPQTVGGMRAHPPKVEKIWKQSLNKKERRKAIRSAMAATMFADIVSARGHKIPNTYPFIAEDAIENLAKTKDVIKILTTWGLKEELERSAVKKIRAGRGKTRGRKHKTRKGVLFVVDSDCKLVKSAKNIPGVNVVSVKKLNVELLAPGGVPGRSTIFTKKAITTLEKEKLFI